MEQQKMKLTPKRATVRKLTIAQVCEMTGRTRDDVWSAMKNGLPFTQNASDIARGPRFNGLEACKYFGVAYPYHESDGRAAGLLGEILKAYDNIMADDPGRTLPDRTRAWGELQVAIEAGRLFLTRQ